MTKNSLEYPRANPVTTASQYALMQAIAHGAVPQQDVSISQELAREMIRKTPRRLRSKFAAEVAKMRSNPKQRFYVVTYAPFNLVREAGIFNYRDQAASWAKQANRIDPNYRGRGLKVQESDEHGFPLAWKTREGNPIMIRHGNPSAEELTETWHGREPKEVIDYEEEEEYEPDGAVLAELEELGIILEDREQTISIEFEEDPPMLVANVNTETLEIVGGDQTLEFGEGWDTRNKSEVSMGHVYLIAYCTDKHHLEGSNGVPESYEHFFGEEFYKGHGYKVDDYKDSEDFFEDLLEDGIVDEAIEQGYLPTMVYDTVNEKIKLVGGKYTIEDVGLRD